MFKEFYDSPNELFLQLIYNDLDQLIEQTGAVKILINYSFGDGLSKTFSLYAENISLALGKIDFTIKKDSCGRYSLFEGKIPHGIFQMVCEVELGLEKRTKRLT